MLPLVPTLPLSYTILVVDDEPDVFAVTKLSLRGVKFHDKKLDLIQASTGAEAVRIMRERPDVALMLLDVVMESDNAGLDVCRTVREELGNPLVRIVLRTGQPGVAPERRTIEDFDIDGYLPKSELTSDRLYAAVRTALKAWNELVELDRQRSFLHSIHECVVSLRSYEPLEVNLRRILTTAVNICQTDFAVLNLETFDSAGNPRRYLLHVTPGLDPLKAEFEAASIAERVRHARTIERSFPSGAWQDGYVEPITLHRELGYGYLYLRAVSPDSLASLMLPMLAAHASNALYSAVSQLMLADRGLLSQDAMAV